MNEQKREKPDQATLDLLGSPNPWTPEIEDRWIAELRKVPAGRIYEMFPPMRKPPNVSRRGKSAGWGG